MRYEPLRDGEVLIVRYSSCAVLADLVNDMLIGGTFAFGVGNGFSGTFCSGVPTAAAKKMPRIEIKNAVIIFFWVIMRISFDVGRRSERYVLPPSDVLWYHDNSSLRRDSQFDDMPDESSETPLSGRGYFYSHSSNHPQWLWSVPEFFY